MRGPGAGPGQVLGQGMPVFLRGSRALLITCYLNLELRLSPRVR